MKYTLLRNWSFLLIGLLAMLPSQLCSQSPYRLEGVKEGFMLAIPTNLHIYARINFINMDPLSKEKAELLRPTDVWALDRWAVKNYPTGAGARKVSDVLLYSSFAWPMTMLASDRARDDIGAMGTFYLEALLINSALTNLMKSMVKRPRPLAYNEFVDVNLKLDKGVRTSFFSGHTSTTAAMTFLTAKMYADFYPDSDLRPVVWASAALIPAATGFLRMRGGKHFFTDVLTGFIVGAAVGYLVPEVHRIK